ncbi:AIR synthase-related protein [Rhodoferax sp. PAMC 29310]|uniref:AIR synthase-related protein n=1 Tax=Rhodoferax sp. PAMC 29310 TaxID=2822760 RepID=UPI00351D5A52
MSDGLLGDLGHVLKQSGVGATVDADIATELIAACAIYTRAEGLKRKEIEINQWRRWALTGGDDYELLFTAPPAARDAVASAARHSQTLITRIGQIDAAPGLRLVDSRGQPLPNAYASFDHFA